MINLLSKTGLGRSGHVRFQTFGPIWHVSGPKMAFWRNDIMILHHFCWRSSKITLFSPKTLIFDQKSKKIIRERIKKGFHRIGSKAMQWNSSNNCIHLQGLLLLGSEERRGCYTSIQRELLHRFLYCPNP